MRTMTRMLILCAVMLAALTATAQTTITATLDTAKLGVNPKVGQPSFQCSGHSYIYCYGVPFVFTDGSVETAWLDTSFIEWLTYASYGWADPLGLQSPNSDDVVTSSVWTPGIKPTTTSLGSGTLVSTFSGFTSSGQPYTGKDTRIYAIYYSSGGGGRGGGGAGYYYAIVGATLSITFN